MSKGIKYTETNSAKISSDDFAGTTQLFSAVAFPKTFEGETEQEQIDEALASGLASEASETIEVKFPLKPPAKPTGLKSSNISYNKTDLAWSASADAQAYTVWQDGKAIKYVEGTSITLTDEDFDGKTINFSVVAYPKKYTGANEQEQIDNALKSNEGSVKSDDLSVTFLERPVTPTNLRTEGLTSEYVKILWNSGSPKGTAWVGHRNNEGNTDPKEAKVLDYDEDKAIELTPEFVGVESLAGMTIIYYIQEFNVKGEGDTDQDKAKYLNENELGSEWSESISITFPKE